MKCELMRRLFQWTKEQALTQIEKIYQSEGFAIVSYVYGAVVVRNNLLGKREEGRGKREDLDQPKSTSCGAPSSSASPHPSPLPKGEGVWREALFGSSIILPDGASLLTRWRVAHLLRRVTGVSRLTNLNGTDFFPYLLEEYLKVWPVNLVCYGTYGGNLPTKSGDVIIPAGEWLQQKYGFTRSYWQDIDYHDTTTERDWEEMSKLCNPHYPTIMMVCLWVPRQELRSYKNRKNLQKYWVIACNQWATIDYWAWREGRAPRLVRTLWLESIRRLASDPRKNWSKFWVSFKMMGEIVKLFIK